MSIDIGTVWAFLDKAEVGFLATHHGAAIAARPMALCARPADNAVYMLTSAISEKDDAIADNPQVCVVVQDGGAYLSLSGEAFLSQNPTRIHELWTPMAGAWWDGPDDPDIRVLTVTPHEAHFWQSPGRLAAMVSMLAAAVGDSRPHIGKDQRLKM